MCYSLKGYERIYIIIGIFLYFVILLLINIYIFLFSLSLVFKNFDSFIHRLLVTYFSFITFEFIYAA